MRKPRPSPPSSSATDHSSCSFSSSSSYSSSDDDLRHKRRHQSRSKSRKRDVGRKDITDERSRSRKEKSSSNKRKYRIDSEMAKKRKRRRNRQVESGLYELEKSSNVESSQQACQKLIHRGDDMPLKQRSSNPLQVAMDMQEQQKAVIRRNAEIAKARLESGELQKAREDQIKMHRLYGSVDWRLKKKLRTEKRILERTLAAGKKLASLEEQEHARMDAFRVALGLPTAEAQRQAEWRAEATQELIEMEARSKCAATSPNAFRSSKRAVIGPSLPT